LESVEAPKIVAVPSKQESQREQQWLCGLKIDGKPLSCKAGRAALQPLNVAFKWLRIGAERVVRGMAACVAPAL